MVCAFAVLLPVGEPPSEDDKALDRSSYEAYDTTADDSASIGPSVSVSAGLNTLDRSFSSGTASGVITCKQN